MIGVSGVPVVCSNSVNAPEILTWSFYIVDSPPASAISPSLVAVQTGALPTYQFTPDVAGGYLVRLDTEDASGNVATDYRSFMVPETSGRIIPPSGATDRMLNVGGQTRGWSVWMEQWLHYLDTLSGGTPTPPFLGTTQAYVSASPYNIDIAVAKIIMVAPNAGAITANLPIGVPAGTAVLVVDDGWAAATNNITVAVAGGLIYENGTSAATTTINKNGQSLLLVCYDAASKYWMVVSRTATAGAAAEPQRLTDNARGRRAAMQPAMRHVGTATPSVLFTASTTKTDGSHLDDDFVDVCIISPRTAWFGGAAGTFIAMLNKGQNGFTKCVKIIDRATGAVVTSLPNTNLPAGNASGNVRYDRIVFIGGSAYGQNDKIVIASDFSGYLA